VPTRFANWERFESDEERVDLHDFVKAYCVQKGIATQFIREQTFDKAQQCRVWWWLSVALYAKSMRTPWLLDSLDNDTSFVGLGFSIDRFARRGEHVVLGCSHLYNARGEGLQYRLTKVEDPIFRGKNCFLSESDARRVGETVRQLFYESKFELPRRVVIHKRAPFLRSEIAGLRRGLEGVTDVEMVEINIDDALRYVASAPRRGGGFEEDRFPVRRGTLVQLAPYEALLWVHGTSGAVVPSRKYYQGKRRIPAPLLLRRHAGSSDLTRVAGEILGLSKMNWNTADFYTKLPATVLSSNQIAHIGSLLDRFGAVAYDYRLLI
jgi:argonaute-like protein implicated in RNA metabolism and viral defense